jgi:hypothetical protein
MGRYSIHKESYKGFTIEINHDEFAESPCERDWGMLSTISCLSNRHYRLGHETKEADDLVEMYRDPEIIALPVRFYEYQENYMEVTDTDDHQACGIVWMTKQDAMDNLGFTSFGVKELKKTIETLKGDVETYSQYLRGNVWKFVVRENGEIVDSGMGFLGEYDAAEYGALACAREVADDLYKGKMKSHYGKVKAWIRNRVPLQYRKPCPCVA